MREKQLPVNENVFNALIMGHSNADDLESAAGILKVMAQAGLEPSADSYTTLMCGYARKGDLESINKYASECEEKEIFLLDKDFLEVIYALAVNGHADKVDAIADKLRKALGYNQDAVNVILRLINRGQEETAMKILKTMPRGTRMTGELTDAGNFLIKQLIKADRPVEQIMSICNQLEESQMNSRPIMIAVEAALASGKSKIAPRLLKEMQDKGLEVRQHYFWPIFAAARTEKEVIEVLLLMQNDFGISASNQTIRDYICPKLVKDGNYENVVQVLRNSGISLASAIAATSFHALSKNKIAKAAEIMSSGEAYYSPGLFRKSLQGALQQTLDFDSYVKIIREIHDNISRAKSVNTSQQKQEVDEEEENDVEVTEAAPGRTLKMLQAEIVGDIVMDAVVQFKVNRVENITAILQGLVDQGLSISSRKAERIQDRFGETMTPELSTLLGKLTSGELEPIPIEKTRTARNQANNNMDVDSIERLVARLEEKGENTKGLKRQMLVAAIRARDIPKTEEIVDRLKGEGYVLSAGVYAQLVELYATSDKLEEALAAVKTIRELDADFELDEIKVIKVVQAFVNADRLDDGLKFLEENKLKETPDEKMFNYQTTCWRLLNSLAEKGQVEMLTKLFDTMVGCNYIIPNNVILGPLIKVHIVKDELKLAVDKFDELCQKYRATPWKNEIACRLIQAEDAANLQRVTDLSTEIHGEVNSLYDLVFSFIECGRVRQARKILETPGLRTRPGRINTACERYLNEGMPTALEGLIEATKDLNHIDRAEIFHSLLQTYIKDVETEKALGLWTTMQEEDITPSDAFLVKLAKFLKSQGQEVPFHVPAAAPRAEKPKVEKPKVEQTKSVKAKEPAAPKKSEVEVSATIAAFKSALKSGDTSAMLTAKDNLTTAEKLSVTDRSIMIEAMVKAENLQDASKQVFEMLAENLHPIPRIFRYYLNRLANSGDTATLEQISPLLDGETKKLLSFDNRTCHSYVASGKSDDYLNRLEAAIDNATTEEQIVKVGEEFPRGGSIGIIEAKPEYADKFEKIAAKYANKKILGPVNVLWMHYFINNDPRAEKIFKEHLVDAPRLMFQRVIQEGREKQDANVISRLITVLHSTKVSEGAIGNAYSCLLDIHAAKNEAAACLTTIDACLKDTCFENINRTALLRAKDCIEKSGQKFPHQIPEKKANKEDSSSSSSSSSSDDEVTRKKAKA
jgi:leucine-rich PPR motif-containing protein, mitochondrial